MGLQYPLAHLYSGQSRDVRVTRGMFCIPQRSDGRIALARRTPDAPSYPNAWNCFGGGTSSEELVLEHSLGRELTEESRSSLTRVVGRLGRPLDMVRIPDDESKPIHIDIAEVFLVQTDGALQLTQETRQIGWFNADELVEIQQEIVGGELDVLGRTARFAFWGASVSQTPLYCGPVTERLQEVCDFPLIPSSTTQLVMNDSMFVRCMQTAPDEKAVAFWPNLQPGVNAAPVVDRLSEVIAIA